MRIRNYFKYVWKNGMLDTMELEQKVLSKLSTALQEELNYEDKVTIYILIFKGRVLKKINLFERYFSKNFIRRISSVVTEEHYSPGDVVYCNQDIGKN